VRVNKLLSLKESLNPNGRLRFFRHIDGNAIRLPPQLQTAHTAVIPGRP
jgi:hypothetical protein